ncbi:hypothetical protein BHE74_00036842 [Ensete ventricosum]|uniref:Uncharacterized protein n=1 Tax=Ensete ventricosum TaxID=4639 RepID=A0A426Y2H6_ENSVE|nr:hypothetical protein B296_00049236 [Ensete ventricosum]RWW56441.1 hypothetical protein BHE74_00036842 [Ensete ventricosum]
MKSKHTVLGATARCRSNIGAAAGADDIARRFPPGAPGASDQTLERPLPCQHLRFKQEIRAETDGKQRAFPRM